MAAFTSWLIFERMSVTSADTQAPFFAAVSVPTGLTPKAELGT
jgi:hypothetical protein